MALNVLCDDGGEPKKSYGYDRQRDLNTAYNVKYQGKCYWRKLLFKKYMINTGDFLTTSRSAKSIKRGRMIKERTLIYKLHFLLWWTPMTLVTKANFGIRFSGVDLHQWKKKQLFSEREILLFPITIVVQRYRIPIKGRKCVFGTTASEIHEAVMERVGMNAAKQQSRSRVKPVTADKNWV